MNEFIGKLQGEELHVAIVVARFNETITQRLLKGALEGLKQQGVNEKNITVAWVPGAFEVPIIAKKFAISGNFEAVISLGAVIRGETSHFDYVAGQASSGVAQVALETGIPIIFGILTTDNTQQALERAGEKMDNKGFEAALVAIEMANLMNQLDTI